ncbi:shikimate kinase [Pseudobutyrivibrio sp. YE44]|uniref:shikimate kinase n=1 Tax=Pseudobutyrivibrio sp. YE44 TaxID=1520802 RepID=UPI0008804904|nr:shikimate kinase [Pseudobutyrivibrio sp. YE44]SDB04479.1 shikimate kinase [Pseudobutyrivibrio sp. YE44]
MANIFLIGFMGTGKSSIASYIGEHFGMSVVEMDETIEANEKMSIKDIFAEKGEAYFRNLETDLLRKIGQGDNTVVSCGGGVPMREENIKVMKESGVTVLLTAEPEIIYKRVCKSNNRPLLNDNMSVEYIADLLGQRREKYEKAADFSVTTDDRDKRDIAQEIIHRIAK